MIEQVIMSALQYEIHMVPPVKQRESTGWWPHYDRDYPDEPVELWGNYECWEWWVKLSLGATERAVLVAWLGTGDKVSSEQEALRICEVATESRYKGILLQLESQYPHEIKKLSQLYAI